MGILEMEERIHSLRKGHLAKIRWCRGNRGRIHHLVRLQLIEMGRNKGLSCRLIIQDQKGEEQKV